MAQDDIDAIIAKARAGAGLDPDEAQALIKHVEAKAPDALPPPPAPAAPEHSIRHISPSLNISGVFGAGDARLTAMRIVDDAGHVRSRLGAGEPWTCEIDYTLARKGMREKMEVVVAFKRGAEVVARIRSTDLLFDEAVKPSGTIRAQLDRANLGPGLYTVTALAAKEGYFDEYQTVFFSMNPGCYCVVSNIGEFTIDEGAAIYEGAAIVLTPEGWLS